jgi:hypothetical protein
MHLLVPLAALLGIEVEAITERVRNTIIVNVAMIGLGLVGVSFLVAAGFSPSPTSMAPSMRP